MSTKNPVQSFNELFGPDPEISQDEAFSILSNPRRRYTIHHLLHNGEQSTIRDISEQVAAWETNKKRELVDSAERKRVYTALQQNHLPKMDEVGLIDFDRDRGHIEKADALDDIDIYLDIAQGRQISWSSYYLSLSFVSLILVGAVGLVGYPFTLLPSLAWAGFIAAIFLISSVTHFYENRSHKFGVGDKPPELDCE